MSRLNPKFKIFSEGGGSVIFLYPGQIWNLKSFMRVAGLGILPCPGSNLKFKIFSEGGGSVIFPCPGQIWNLKFWWGWVIFSCPGWIQSLKLFREGRGSVMVQSNLKFKNFSEGWGFGHLTMSRQNLKLKFLVRMGVTSYHVQAKSEI